MGRLFSAFKELFSSGKELSEARRIQRKYKVTAYLVESTGILREVIARLDKSERFLYVDNMKKIFLRNPKSLYYTEKLEPVYFLSENNVFSLNLGDIAKKNTLWFAMDHNLKVNYNARGRRFWDALKGIKEKNDIWQAVTFEKDTPVTPTLDMMFDDKWDIKGHTGYDFTSVAQMIMSTKTFEFMEMPARRMILITAILSLMGGGFITAILFFTIDLVLSNI